ncbi:hypothetical protein [Pyrobaculum ferrireducens]|uniref:Uncharacterized protein n=1 Tax=Pyrobaculum ferrireducens TaxID=1104324 RepID=G7VHH8_9CREN|nr:hypothetical protein [Pyrobaculum ferrireducens]AET33269.1 hypothetical protein P186_1867 [Pyrobaculum ferrireducens]
MSVEIPLEEPAKKEGGGLGYILLGVTIGLAVGVAVGYYVNTATLQYAYKLLSEAQSPPPDVYLVAYKPGRTALMTAMGTPLYEQPFGVDQPLAYVGDSGEFSIFYSPNYVYVVKGSDVYTKLLVEGIKAASLMDGNLYVGAGDGVVKLALPDLDEKGRLKMDNVNDLIAMPDEKEIYVLTKDKLYILDQNLEIIKEFPFGGDKLFVGAYYFFITRGGVVSSYERTTGRQLASYSVVGEVVDLRACRGILLVVTAAKTYALRVPDLSLIKVLDVGGIRLRADSTCSLVYILGDNSISVVLLPSLSIHNVKTNTAFDDLAIRTGAGAVAAQVGGKRQIALACGG